MFEERLKRISRGIGEEEKKKFYILKYKQHRREIYFSNNKNAIDFMRMKFFNSLKKLKWIKRFAYFLIRLGLLQLFLKRTELSSKFGDIIFAGGQIKGFDLNRKLVSSFPIEERWNQAFIESKRAQRKFGEMEFAPKIFELNEKIPYSREELLQNYSGNDDFGIFNRLILFYNLMGMERKSIKSILKDLRIRLRKKGIMNEEIENLLNKLSKSKTKILLARTHGDFSEEQVLKRNGKYVFVDWHSDRNITKKEIIIGDLIRFFKKEINLPSNERFKKILNLFPKEVVQNREVYIALNEIDLIIRRGEISPVSLNRIKSVLEQQF